MEPFLLSQYNVFFSRGMDGINPNQIHSQEKKITDALSNLGMTISNPFIIDDPRRHRVSGIAEIVENDLLILKNSDFVIADLSIPDRSYIGAIFELSYAFEHNKQIFVWVGSSGNEKRIWLKYYATAICKSFEQLYEVLSITFTDAGRRENERENIEYYGAISGEYEEKEREFSSIKKKAEDIEKYNREHDALRRWVKGLNLHGTIIDLGSGPGLWVPIWGEKGKRVICVDVSPEMLSISTNKNKFSNVEHVQGNILEPKWLETFLCGLNKIDIIVLSFVLNSFSLEQEKQLISFFRRYVSLETHLILLENQSAVFSTAGYFSRYEVQHRITSEHNRRYKICKRNFLLPDVCRALRNFGKIEDIFFTEDYFIGGVACLSK